MSDMKATRSQNLTTFDEVLQRHAEHDDVIVMIAFVTPEGLMEIEMDANAHAILSDIIERLQAVSRALAN